MGAAAVAKQWSQSDIVYRRWSNEREMELNFRPDTSPPQGNRDQPKALDANRYATKKTIAQGMLDVALLTANASQLKYVLQLGDSHPFYELMISLIVISIVLQVVAGILFLVIGGLNINEGSPNQRTADILNDVIVVIIFLITLINVVNSGFGIRATDPGQIKN